MYLRGSKWNMRRKRPRVNWFLIIILVLLILAVSYFNRFIIPTVESPFIPTPTETRQPESFVSEAEAFTADGKFAQAIDSYLQAIRLDPDNASLYIALARAQIFAGRYDDALLNASDALLLSPDNSMAYALRAWALTRKGELDEADRIIQEALRLEPNNAVAHAYYAFLLGNMFEQDTGPYLDPIQLAIDESNTAMALGPDKLEVRWARAYVLYITGNNELAIQQYIAAIEINSNISQLHLELGVVYRQLNNIELAVQEYTLANTYNPSDPLPDLYTSRAWAFVGQWAKAVQSAQDAVRDAPTDPYMRGNLAYMLYENFEWVEADQQYVLTIFGGQSEDGETIQAIPISADPWVSRYYYTYALLLADLGRCAEVLSLTQVIMAALPSDEFAMFNSEYALTKCENQPTPRPTAVLSPTTRPTP
jgi:tetratricopeptide (TPR) repeat protein